MSNAKIRMTNEIPNSNDQGTKNRVSSNENRATSTENREIKKG